MRRKDIAIVIDWTPAPDTRRQKEMAIFDSLPDDVRRKTWDDGVKIMRRYLQGWR